MTVSLEGLSKQDLLTRIRALIRRGHAVEAELLSHLGEVDARRLYLEEACSSMFVYCVSELHFSEAAAYKRIAAARAARRHPEILVALRQGDLHVTAVSLLAPQLTAANCEEWIRAARHKTAEEIRRLLADWRPKPDVRDCVRRIPEKSTLEVAGGSAGSLGGAARAGSHESPEARSCVGTPAGGAVENYGASGEGLHEPVPSGPRANRF